MPDRSKLAKNTAFQYGLQAAKYLFPLITIPYLTRVLGPDIYAVRAYMLAVMTFMLVFLDFGFLNFGTKAIAESQTRQQQGEIASAITCLRACLCLAGFVVLIPLTLSIPIMAAWPLYVLLAYLGTCLKAFLPDFIFQGQEDMGIITYRYVVSQGVCILLIFALVHGPQDLLWVPALEALANLIALIWSWANVFRKRGIRLHRPTASLLKTTFSQSAVFFVSSASTAILSSLTTLLIGIFIEDDALISYWSIAMTAIVAVQALYAPITNSLYPHMVKNRDFDVLKKLLITGMPVVLVGTIAFAALSDVIMLVLGGEAFLPGSYIIAMVSPILLLSYPALLLGFPVLAATGHVKELTITTLLAALFQLVGLIVLAAIGAFTIEAVAILRCCSELVLLVSRVYFTVRLRKEMQAA